MRNIRILLLMACLYGLSPAAVDATEPRAYPGFGDSSLKSETSSRIPGSVMLPVSLPGSLLLDITLAFDDVTDLSLATAGISAAVISPLDGSITSRFPAGDVTIPELFPVLVLIEPPGVGITTLAFDGTYDLTLLTPNLPYFPGTRLRLFSAHDGGDFEDITYETSEGSYRVRGSGGTFSEFLIVLDNREETAIISTKIVDLDSLLSSYSGVIDSTVFANLESLLDLIDSAWTKGDLTGAMTSLDDFIAALDAATPAQIPDNWDATGGPDNASGVLRAKAATLKFSLSEYAYPSRKQ